MSGGAAFAAPARIGDEDNILPEYQVPFIFWAGVHLSN
jgi:hypothetical protein